VRLFNKLVGLFAVFISLAGIALADSTGIVFNWHPFIVNNYLEFNHSLKNILPKNLSTSKEIWRQFDDTDELLYSDWKTIDIVPDVTAKKSALNNIKVTFSPVNSFMLPGDEIYSKTKEGKLSQASRSLPSLLRNPSQEMAVETLKLFEPQVNLGFEF
jgi:hypothetical protein